MANVKSDIRYQTLYRYHYCGTLCCLMSVPVRIKKISRNQKKKVKTSLTFSVCLGLKHAEKKS